MRELVRDKGRLEDIVEYSANVIKIIENKASHPETPWKQVEGMRHVLVHGYSQVLPRILWATAKESIPEIKKQVERYLAETDWEYYGAE